MVHEALIFKRLSGLWSFVFRLENISPNMIPVQEKYITKLYYNFILKSDLKIPRHPSQDKHLLNVLESLFTSQSQNPSRGFCVYECRSIGTSPSVDHFIFNFAS